MTRIISFEQAKARYVHRFTCQNVPDWSRFERSVGVFYGPHFLTDREWYENTVFPGETRNIAGHGSVYLKASERHCHTMNHSFPHGQKLGAAYRQGFPVVPYKGIES